MLTWAKVVGNRGKAQKLLLQFEDPVTLLFESNLFTSSSHKGCASLHLRAGKRNEEEVGRKVEKGGGQDDSKEKNKVPLSGGGPKRTDYIKKFGTGEGPASEPKTQPITTMMLKNIPCRKSQEEVMGIIDDEGFKGQYDFFYLPRDVKFRANLGYAFINFVTPEETMISGSAKACNVVPAHVQGAVNNLQAFKRTEVMRSNRKPYFSNVGCALRCLHIRMASGAGKKARKQKETEAEEAPALSASATAARHLQNLRRKSEEPGASLAKEPAESAEAIPKSNAAEEAPVTSMMMVLLKNFSLFLLLAPTAVGECQEERLCMPVVSMLILFIDLSVCTGHLMLGFFDPAYRPDAC
eukprot:g15882.t1